MTIAASSLVSRGLPRAALFGVPTLYTTYNRALQYIPNTRFTISYLLVEPKTPGGRRDHQGAGRLPRLSRADAAMNSSSKISKFYMYQTGIGTNMMLMTLISFIVGLSISGPDLLHVHPGEPRQVRRPEGDRRQGARARSR